LHFHPTMTREAGDLTGAYQGETKAFPRGRAEPAPPGGVSPGEMALRGEPGNNAKDDFLGGARSPRPGGKAVRKRGVGRDERGVIERPDGLPGRCLGQAQCLPLRACGARPSRGRAELRWPRGEGRGSRERGFSRWDALCASQGIGSTHDEAWLLGISSPLPPRLGPTFFLDPEGGLGIYLAQEDGFLDKRFSGGRVMRARAVLGAVFGSFIVGPP